MKTKRHLLKEVNKALYIVHVPIHSSRTAFYEKPLCTQSWMRGRVSLLSPPNHESKGPEFPFSPLTELAKLCYAAKAGFFLDQGFPIWAERHQMSPVMYTEGDEVKEKVLQTNLSVKEKHIFIYRENRALGRKGDSEQWKTILENLANWERAPPNYKGWSEYWIGLIRIESWRIGDVCKSFGSLSLLPNQFSWPDCWQRSFWHLFAKTFANTVFCWVTRALVPVCPKQQKFLYSFQLPNWTNWNYFLSFLQSPEQFFLEKWAITLPNHCQTGWRGMGRQLEEERYQTPEGGAEGLWLENRNRLMYFLDTHI